jgi:hypothetical protein
MLSSVLTAAIKWQTDDKTRWREAAVSLLDLGRRTARCAWVLITESTGREPTAWLNLAVCMLAFFIDTAGPLFFPNSTTRFSQKIPAIAILWFIDVFYTVASLGVIIAGWQWGIQFRFQLLAQLAILLAACGIVLTSMHATEHAANVGERERGLLANIDSLRDGMKSLVMLISRLPALSALAEEVGRCSEDVRYMTPSKNALAVELESQLLETIRRTEAFLTNQSSDSGSQDDLRDGVAKRLEELTFLLHQRKTCSLE